MIAGRTDAPKASPEMPSDENFGDTPKRASRLRRIAALAKKEAIEVVRDPSSILIAFVMPLILLFLFGYGVSLDVNKIKVGIVLEDSSPDAQSFAGAVADSRFFSARIARARHAFVDDLVAGRIRGIIVVPIDFTARLNHPGETAPVQVIADGTQPNTASFVHNYVTGVWSGWLRQRALERGRHIHLPIVAAPRFWFNAKLTSRNFLVPGSVAIIMTLIGTLLTALVIAREWERGTMEAIMATPVTAGELLIGKIIPYFLLAMASMVVCTLIAVFLFQVPLRGSIGALVAVSSAFLVPALGQGYLISAITKNQFVASQIALFSAFLPAVLLSGFVFEIGSMPKAIQIITHIVPARYFVSSLQTVFMAGDFWALLLPNIAAMLGIGVLFLVLALRNTKKRLD
ncbi:ABC transporter permease [Varunaivibrio sulfuroxidans]|uniref:ABC-2 type transport system permease protein n=1 Tax=Varunaivibrio sulfuroxidans TaxID=1773489 RepID=A0A4R3J5R9_9PROT|nr:ABC transporter permease [Varunaivibrio sulfuroxidans]TCS60675.1 ABC-2 type transport system permease protein [Varunaivibrio sulfuroxidans]WES30164.1 ABC transporter permease [Varunaivibrio sulfuroxidans]